MQTNMIEYSDRRVWNVNNQKVTFLHIDSRFAFECYDALSVIIETPFSIRYTDRVITCIPEDVNSVKEAVQVLHKLVSTLTAYRDGQLLITFSDGMERHVSKHQQYESWEAQGRGELQDLSLHCTGHEGPPWGQ
jgi:hypothetical protein